MADGEITRQPTRKKAGRKPKTFGDDVRKRVYQLAMIGCGEESIAAIEGIARETLRKHFPDELNKGREDGMRNLRAKQYQRAMEGSDRMLEHLGKHWLGQTDKLIHEGGDKPLTGEITLRIVRANAD